jgi:hypothetical protein
VGVCGRHDIESSMHTDKATNSPSVSITIMLWRLICRSAHCPARDPPGSNVSTT